MVWRRRSTAAGLQHAEPDGVDWELPSSIGLTWERRTPRRSFRASHGSSGSSSDGGRARPELGFAVTVKITRERERIVA
jgi:hypothetical protein